MDKDEINPHHNSYKRYIEEVKRQLKEAKDNVERIPKLERVAKMTFDEWLGFQKIQVTYNNCIKEQGIIYYFERPDPNVNPQMYHPVSYEHWKMLRDLEPSKFNVDYECYVQLKEEQFEREVEYRKTVSIHLKSVYYSTHPKMIEQTRKSLRKIIENPFFDRWASTEESEMVNNILTL